MKDSTYNKLWTECVEKAGINILSIFPGKVVDRFNWRCDFTEEKRKEVFLRYKNNHDEFRKRYFYDSDDPEKLIDVHKIAACFAKSVIEASLMSFDKSDDMPWYIKASNYALAFHVSVNIVTFFLQAEYVYTANESNEYMAKLMKKGSVSYPSTTKGHDTYTIGRIKSMALRDINGEEFDMLAYADMLFWIEYYNRQLVEEVIFVKPREPLQK